MPRSFRRKYLQSGGRRHLGLAEKIIGVIRRNRRKGMVRSVEEASEFIDVTTFRQSSGKSFQAYAKNRSQPHCFSQLSGSRRVTQTCRRTTAAGRMTTCEKKVFDGFGVKATQREFQKGGAGRLCPASSTTWRLRDPKAIDRGQPNLDKFCPTPCRVG